MHHPTAVTDFVMKACATKNCYHQQAFAQLHQAGKSFAAIGPQGALLVVAVLALIVIGIRAAISRQRTS